MNLPAAHRAAEALESALALEAAAAVAVAAEVEKEHEGAVAAAEDR